MEEIFQDINLNTKVFNFLKESLIVIGIGLLLGLEREYSKSKDEGERLFAGVRTFPIVALMGYLSLFIGSEYSIWIFIICFLGVIGLTIISYVNAHELHYGTTTEFSLVITFFLGSLIYMQEYQIAVASSIIVFALLAFKIEIHKVVKQLSDKDIFSILQFVIITALILPLLPNEGYGPYETFNPYKIWLIVSIFVSLNFVGYFLSKFFDTKHSVILTGIFGGFASSTATAWYFSRESRNANMGKIQAAAVILASSIMFPRVLIWLLFLNMSLFYDLWIPVLVFGLFGFLFGITFSRKNKSKDISTKREVRNPINIKEAFIFAIIYIAIQLFVGYAEGQFGDQGVLIASGISGLSDVDAITISMANYAGESITMVLAGAAVLIAAFANTFVKYSFCLLFGNKELKKFTSIAFIPLILIGIGYIVFRLVV